MTTHETQTVAPTTEEVFARFREHPVSIGTLIFPELDQIDFTGPFEILSRLPNATIHVIGTEAGPFKDINGMTVMPDVVLDDTPELDLLCVAGGPGQQRLMDDEKLLGFIRRHVARGKPLFSVCTGALLCGAAGILKGRRVTTHWTAIDLLPLFGAIPVADRVVMDGPIVSAAGVTAGLDGALRVAALIRGDAAAQAIQLEIQYAPEPPFNAGSPESAPPDVAETVRARYRALGAARAETVKRISKRLGVQG